jgi:aspartate aminotransferase-like enzyme
MSFGDLLPGPRVLLGPGPAMADPRVLRAMSMPLLGQFDPEFTQIMNEVMDLTRFAFQTTNARTFPVPGTGRAGLEAALVSLVEPGDRVVVIEHGRFGLLLIEIAERCGAEIAAVRGGRQTRVRSNYLDLGQLADYWSPTRFNHHTAPTAMVYGLREALRAVHDEGLEARFARHRLHGEALRAGLDASGLSLFGDEPRQHRLAFLTLVVVPDGVDELRVRRRLVEDFGLEIGAAFGQLQGKIWRIGTMGYSAQRQFVLLCLAALEDVLRREGCRAPAGAGVDAALAHYASSVDANRSSSTPYRPRRTV